MLNKSEEMHFAKTLDEIACKELHKEPPGCVEQELEDAPHTILSDKASCKLKEAAYFVDEF